MNTENVIHLLSASQYVRVQRRANEVGKTVEQYLVSFLSERVGTTLSALNKQGKRLSA